MRNQSPEPMCAVVYRESVRLATSEFPRGSSLGIQITAVRQMPGYDSLRYVIEDARVSATSHLRE